MTSKREILELLGFTPGLRDTRDFPYYGDRFTAYRRGTTSDYTKARTAYIKKFGIKSWRQDIKPFIYKDKMSIFWKKPSRKRIFFVNRLAWSSERRIKESSKLGKIIQRGFK